LTDLAQSIVRFVQDHPGWAAPVVFLLAFCESFAFISLIVPATGILLVIGGFVAAARLDFGPIWLAASLGALVGDWLAYVLAFRFKEQILAVWPFCRYPALVARGVRFFERWGMIAVFVGRFFGPFRAIVPIAAGMHAMPWLEFQIANLASALLWGAGILAPGFVGMRWLVG
jgi:membrane protein DedA with SNARE-associated domain